MPRKDPAVDAYIERAPAYAQPILRRIRRVFHRASPQLEEAMKWGAPHFVREGIVGGMAAFKQHVAFGFWKAKAMQDPAGLFGGDAKASPFAVKVASTRDLPPDDVLAAYVREAVALNESGVKAGARGGGTKKPRPTPRAPADLMAALQRSPRALATWRAFTPGRRRDYVEWILEAKREETRQKRITTTVAWTAEGKERNWKYRRC